VTCILSVSKIPGIEKIAYGYNVYKGDPRAYLNDPGVSASLYTISYD